jgi:hypothetical protein
MPFTSASARSIADPISLGIQLLDANGQRMDYIDMRQQGMVKVTISNSQDTDQPFVILVEIRDGTGVTEFIRWQSGILSRGERYDFETSWLPQNGCSEIEDECSPDHEIRAFAVSNLENPLVLTAVESVQVIVVGDTYKLYRLDIDGTAHHVEYSIDSGDVEKIYADPNLGALTLQLEGMVSDANLTVILTKDLMDAVFLNWVYPLPSGEKPEYLPEIVVDTIFVQPISLETDLHKTRWVIPIQKGSEEVEFVIGFPV